MELVLEFDWTCIFNMVLSANSKAHIRALMWQNGEVAELVDAQKYNHYKQHQFKTVKAVIQVRILSSPQTLKFNLMKIIQFALSMLIAICAIGMLYGAITTYSPIKKVSVTIMSIILLGCVSLVRLTYKEIKE